MRHKHGYRNLGRASAPRRALLRNLTTSLLQEERINTTLQKAKEVQSVVERMITYGKKGTLHHRRLAASYVFGDEAVSKLFNDFATRFKDRAGGYTRIIRRAPRLGDGAKMAFIEFVDRSAAKKD
jgi:large subunit ribosomal protein L17